ncbi:MAG: hypothetical protein C0493_14265 [Kytococcus sp.]|nr:hypothetical protein [Kytococcus sp.]
MRHVWAMTAAALCLVPVSACAGDTTTDPSTTQAPTRSTTTGGKDMQEEIATTLEATSPTIARAVRADTTSISPIEAAALGDWQVVDVLPSGGGHPQRWFMGIKDSGREVVVLSGFPERWEQVIEGARVTSADEAEELAAVHADATRDMTKGYARLSSVDDIRFVPTPSEEETARIEAVRRDHADDISAATVTGDGPWIVELWTVTDGDLVRHDVTVGTDGAITDATEVVEADLPVPETV